jgi:ABC-type uncharacterized transport system permease subunit
MVFSAILMSMFYIGGELAQSRLGLPKSLTGVFQGLLLFTLLACDTLVNYREALGGTNDGVLRTAHRRHAECGHRAGYCVAGPADQRKGASSTWGQRA